MPSISNIDDPRPILKSQFHELSQKFLDRIFGILKEVRAFEELSYLEQGGVAFNGLQRRLESISNALDELAAQYEDARITAGKIPPENLARISNISDLLGSIEMPHIRDRIEVPRFTAAIVNKLAEATIQAAYPEENTLSAMRSLVRTLGEVLILSTVVSELADYPEDTDEPEFLLGPNQ